VTYSTTFYEPYHVARLFASMDLLLGGRMAWNVVTSLNDAEAANFGQQAHLGHDERYDRADEFIEVVLGHWSSWADGAIVADRETGLFADPARVTRLDHSGKYFRSRGPLTVPRSAQGQPVIIQAGQSGRGKQFAGRWGEVIFVVYPNLEVGRKSYADMRGYLQSIGRNTTAITPAVYTIVAETRSMAEDKVAYIESLAKPQDTLVLLSEVLNYDLSKKAPGEPFSDDELEAMTGVKSTRDRIIQLAGKKNPTIDDFIKYSGRATIREFPLFVGSPKDVADSMEEWFLGDVCDGFVIAAANVPGSYEDFVRLVVPELQRRGTFRKDFTGTTLRENLGLGAFQPMAEG
jgi:FMN-dependent oxidoreductase (nitrilotriacetate monooxygenase family)